jgi:hypothetical protein
LKAGVREFKSFGAAVEAGDGLAVKLFQNLLAGFQDGVDDAGLQGFLVGEGLGFGDSQFGYFRITVALGGVAAEIGGGIAHHFLLHGLVRFPAPKENRRSRAGGCPRSHDSDVGSQENEKPGRSRPAAGGGDVNDHGHLGGGDGVDNLAHGIGQPARGVDPEQNGVGVNLLGVLDALGDVLGRDGLDDFVGQADFHDGSCVYIQGEQKPGDHDGEDERGFPHSMEPSSAGVSAI